MSRVWSLDVWNIKRNQKGGERKEKRSREMWSGKEQKKKKNKKTLTLLVLCRWLSLTTSCLDAAVGEILTVNVLRQTWSSEDFFSTDCETQRGSESRQTNGGKLFLQLVSLRHFHSFSSKVCENVSINYKWQNKTEGYREVRKRRTRN